MAVASGPWEAREVHGMWFVIRAVDWKPLVGVLVPLTEDNARYIADSRTSIEELTEQVKDMYTAEEYDGLQEDCDGLEVDLDDARKELDDLKKDYDRIEEELGTSREDARKMRIFIEEHGLNGAFKAGE